MKKQESKKPTKRQKREALYQKDVPSIDLTKPVDLVQFFNARSTEISILEKNLAVAQLGLGRTVIQMLPRSLRRRAASHNVKRLPKSVRQKALDKQVDVPKLARKKRIRYRKLKRKYLFRQKNKGWLETHIWHAKRMKMLNIWGNRVSDRPTEKCLKNLIRSSNRTCFLHDASYMICLQVNHDTKSNIIKLVQPYLDPSTNLGNNKFSCGKFSGKSWIYKNYPKEPIGPIEFMWSPDETCLWLWVHPSMKPFLQENFLTSNHFQIITLNRFQLQGPQSIPILQTILLELKSESSDFFRSIYGHGVGEGSIIALDVYDPRLSFPPKMSKRNANPTPISLSNWPSNLVENAKIFDSESRCKALKSKKPDAYFKRRREKRLIPGKPLSPIETDHSLPILLVSSENGWDLIVPEGYGMVFWLSLVFCGAKIGGQRDIQIINFENQKRTFPYDYPCTPAYKEYIERLNTESELKWNRTPVAKRPNYPKLNTISPFVARFDEQSWILRTHEEIRQFLKGDPTLYEHALIPIQGILKKGIAPIASMIYHPNDTLKPIGYVTRGGFSFRHSKGFILGYCKAIALLDLNETQQVFVRHPGGMKLRPVKIQISL